jgi:hypothetical protein
MSEMDDDDTPEIDGEDVLINRLTQELVADYSGGRVTIVGFLTILRRLEADQEVLQLLQATRDEVLEDLALAVTHQFFGLTGEP